jgi:hypothetical protein
MKPSDLFIGAMDFFAILMPGALLAFLLLPAVPQIFGPVLPALEGEAARWIAFAVTAYLLGHALHHVGGFLDHWYDKVYVAEKRKFGDERLLVESRTLARADLGDDLEGISTFHWAGSYVRAHNATAAAEIERLGGDSKFFRSLCLVGAIALVGFLLRGQPVPAVIAGIASVFAYLRFCKQRWESTQRTYEYFVLLRRLAAAKPPVAGDAAKRPEQASEAAAKWS